MPASMRRTRFCTTATPSVAALSRQSCVSRCTRRPSPYSSAMKPSAVIRIKPRKYGLGNNGSMASALLLFRHRAGGGRAVLERLGAWHGLPAGGAELARVGLETGEYPSAAGHHAGAQPVIIAAANLHQRDRFAAHLRRYLRLRRKSHGEHG